MVSPELGMSVPIKSPYSTVFSRVALTTGTSIILRLFSISLPLLLRSSLSLGLPIRSMSLITDQQPAHDEPEEHRAHQQVLLDTELLCVLGVQSLPAAELHRLAANDTADGSSAEQVIHNIETNVPPGSAH